MEINQDVKQNIQFSMHNRKFEFSGQCDKIGKSTLKTVKLFLQNFFFLHFIKNTSKDIVRKIVLEKCKPYTK